MSHLWVYGAIGALVLLILLRVAAKAFRAAQEESSAHIRHEEMNRFGFEPGSVRPVSKDWRRT